MGIFLSMSCVARRSPRQVEHALKTFAAKKRMEFSPSEDGNEGDFLCLIDSLQGHVTALYPDNFYFCSDASEHLSSRLKTSVFAFHIHDGDFWMFELYTKGRQVDQFNPMPDYWDENLPIEEVAHWRGDPARVAQYWPGVKEEDLRNYLVRWDRQDPDPPKAYPEDEHRIGEDMQLFDFMSKLGLDYPYNREPLIDRGNSETKQARRRSFRFKGPQSRP